MTIYNMADRYRIMIQNWSPYLITISTLICVILLWTILKIQNIYGSDEKANLTAYYIKEQIKSALDNKIQALVLLENRWNNQPHMSFDAWEANANTLVAAIPKLEAIAWMNTEYAIQHVAPTQETLWIESNDFKKIKLLLQEQSLQHKSLIIKPILFPKGENGLMVIIPSYVDNQPKGFILGFIDFSSLLTPIFTTEMIKNYKFHIAVNNELFFGKNSTTTNNISIIALDFTLYDQKWKIEVEKPALALKDNNQIITSNAIIILGLMLSFVLFYTLKNTQIARLRLKEIQKIQAFSSRAQQLAQLGGWVWNLENNKIWCSEVALHILGKSHNEAWMSAQDYLKFIPAHDRKRFIHDMQERISNQQSISETQTICRTDNVERVVHLEAKTTRRRNGEATEITGIIQDITEKLEMEKQLRHGQKMEVLGQLTGGLSHDFNNILMIIRGNIELLQIESSFNNSQQKRISSMLNAVERGSELTKHLLGFSRQKSLKPEIVNFYELMPNFIKMLKPTLGESIEITMHISQDIWPVWVDIMQLQTALLNLALNARDAMHYQGKIFFKAENYTSIDTIRSGKTKILPGDYIKISVVDTGEGMSPEIQERAFEPFFTTKAVGKGSGLGLSMVYGFVNQSKGYVTIQSEANQGTTVTLYLPKTKSAIHTTTKEEKTSSDITPQINDAKTILIVEDEESLREMTVEFFKNAGHIILQAPNGPKALELIENNSNIDLLLSDMIMPGGMTGVDLALAAIKANADIKILLVTGYAKESLSMKDLPKGFIPEILVKPYSLVDLQKKVYELLSTVK
ncbi:response regulator [Candidatus Berkiella cookevillensis]|nr:ATP-binding protein [Candidatus Berkiella cookevillensis]MCS5707388.1 response regulator [Candidatus Berkiella cookevillensis]